MNLRMAKCDLKNCAAQYVEEAPGDGFPGWGQLSGIKLNGVENPMLCPEHLVKVAEFIDSIEEK